MFIQSIVDIGIMRVGEKKTIYFEYDTIGKIVSLTSPCDCSHPGNDPERNRITVEYKAKSIPEHLKLQGKTQYAIRKEIEVTSLNPDSTHKKDILIFIGIVRS